MQEKTYFYTVHFYLLREGKSYIQPLTGTREQLQEVVDRFQADDAIESAAVVYQSTYSVMDSAPVVVKKKNEKEETK